MGDIQREKYFFLFLLNNSNLRQNIALLRYVTTSQYSILQGFANDILEERLPLNRRQFQELVQYKNFIRKLGSCRVTSTTLIRNINAIKSIVDIVFNENEVCNKTSANTHSRMGESEETFTSKKYPEYSGSGSDSSYETGGSDEEFWGKTGGSEKEEAGLFESDGEEEEKCHSHN